MLWLFLKQKIEIIFQSLKMIPSKPDKYSREGDKSQNILNFFLGNLGKTL